MNPILVLHPKGQLPAITDLKDYDPTATRDTFRSKTTLKPLLPRIDVYLKEELAGMS